MLLIAFPCSNYISKVIVEKCSSWKLIFCLVYPLPTNFPQGKEHFCCGLVIQSCFEVGLSKVLHKRPVYPLCDFLVKVITHSISKDSPKCKHGTHNWGTCLFWYDMYSPISIIRTLIIQILEYPNFRAKQKVQVKVQISGTISTNIDSWLSELLLSWMLKLRFWSWPKGFG